MLPIIFADRSDEADFLRLDPRVKYLTALARLWAAARRLERLIVTDVMNGSGHRSATHRELRAVDFISNPWDVGLWEEFAEFVHDHHLRGQMKLIVVGRFDPSGGHNTHVHVQVPRPYRRSDMATM